MRVGVSADATLIGPRRGFSIWGYPKENRVPRKVKEGAEELIRFTEAELKTHKR